MMFSQRKEPALSLPGNISMDSPKAIIGYSESGLITVLPHRTLPTEGSTNCGRQRGHLEWLTLNCNIYELDTNLSGTHQFVNF